MSALRMSVSNTDFDAAQALLDLQGPIKQPNSYGWHTAEQKKELQQTATLFWNCFISSEVPPVPITNPPESNTNAATTTAQSPKVPEPNVRSNNYKTELLPKEHVSRLNYRAGSSLKIVDGDVTEPSHKVSRLGTDTETDVRNVIRGSGLCTNKVETREIGTQTEECRFNPSVVFMETTIQQLCKKIQLLEAQLKDSDASAVNFGLGTDNDEDTRKNDNSYEISYDDNDVSIHEEVPYESNSSQYLAFPRKIQLEDSDEHTVTKKQKNEGTLEMKVTTNHNNYPNSNDLVPIGTGHATVPARLLKHINWNSYTSATRKLLRAVFSRRILATHSLTGKPSPAFPNKPAKKKLDSTLVNDIVQTVVERCAVPENIVRTSITTKCADESKMFRTRQNNKKKRSSRKNRENVPPTTSESESEDY